MSLIGLILLSNLYISRCFFLYQYFRGLELEKGIVVKDSMWSVIVKKFSNPRKHFNLFLITSFIMIIPGFILTATVDGLHDGSAGDHCYIAKGRILLITYTAIFVCIFIYIATKIRTLGSFFRIKQELFVTAIASIFSVFVWWLFNIQELEPFSKLQPINDDFPVSTLALFLGMLVVFYQSTVWPVYRSYSLPLVNRSLKDDDALSVDLSLDFTEGSADEMLKCVLAHEKAFESFREFLTPIFAVETLLYWDAVERLGKICRNPLCKRSRMLKLANDIFDRYLGPKASLKVPDEVSSIEDSIEIELTLDQHYLDIQADGDGFDVVDRKDGVPPLGPELEELFEEAHKKAYIYIRDTLFPAYAKNQNFQELSIERMPDA